MDLGGREGHGDGKGEVRPKEGFKREREKKKEKVWGKRKGEDH